MTGERSLNALRRKHRNLSAEEIPMTDYKPCKLDLIEGMPPEGEEGAFLGFDNDYKPCLLQWNAAMPGWMGLAFGPPPNTPAAFIPNADGTQQVTRFVFLPALVKAS